ncbi:MAG TPA: tRNA pseudouridine(55) synthase TruB [Candidatus Omnitrophota bacterium]|nr:tRNA pseudouridine(55) synthase TruB [Candidatus Omnitrophota bacterium]
MKKTGRDTLNGILIVDKPLDWTSHDVCSFIRKRFRFVKVGHAGILDRTATGVLVVLVGLYTKLSSRFLNEDKEYRGVMELGARTTTHDWGGEVVEKKAWEHIGPEEIKTVFESFQGEQEQLPPMASAVKRDGVRLYKLARKGQEVDRPRKAIRVYELRIEKIEIPSIHFYCRVSKGTYVRTLVNDMGIALGTCAHLKELRRLASGKFRIEDSLTIDFLKTVQDPEELKPYLKALPLAHLENPEGPNGSPLRECPGGCSGS